MAKYLVVFCVLVVNALGDSSINWRIVGGSDAPDGEYKYQVSVMYDGEHVCGGSIISKEFVVTAAHCVDGYVPRYFTVLAGTNTLSQGGTFYEVFIVFVHEQFDYDAKINDVAVLWLKTNITFTDTIQPIPLDTDYVGGGEDVIVTGWGLLRNKGDYPDNLQEIHLKTIEFQDCKSRIVNDTVVDTQICTFTKIGEGFCSADSGGPLVRSVGGIKKLVGISSYFPEDLCAVGYPDVYTRVSSYIHWINDTCFYSLPSM